MKGLAELVVSLCDLFEAEGRLLEAGILRTVRRAGFLSLGMLFGAAALALLLGALYALLTSLLPTPAALALLGGASAVVAAILLRSARGSGAPKPERGAGKEAPEETAPGRQAPRAAAQKPGPVEALEESHAPWAQVSPYGHGAVTHTPRKTGDGPSSKGGDGTRKTR